MPVEPEGKNQLIEAGKQIFLNGKLPDGESISARVRGDIRLQGSQYACANCHRRSGVGSSEGGDQVPPVFGKALFSPISASLHDSYRKGEMNTVTRPAYTIESLGQVIRKGIDPAGRILSPLMPRFELTDNQILALSSYLASMSITMPPGVDEQDIHFATITTPGNESVREAMLDVFNTFFRFKNAGTRGEKRRAQNAPYHKAWVYESYRRWKLHEWRLYGPEKGWQEQLNDLYNKQPVFAIIGGVGGNWQPVHRFCEQQQLPCLFPHIPLAPSKADEDFYSVYFSRGVNLEAQALTRHLEETIEYPQKVIQVLDKQTAAQSAAKTLRKGLAANKMVKLIDIEIESDQPLVPTFWRELAAKHDHAAWVLWLDAGKLQDLKKTTPAVTNIYLSASLQQDVKALQQHPIRSHFTLLTPYRANDSEKSAQRFQIWARLRGLPVTNLHLQSSSFLTATLVGETLMHMRSNFSREYFIERIEHIADNLINPSLYPRISLAPGQRFAAKGCYLWEMSKDFDTARWIVP